MYKIENRKRVIVRHIGSAWNEQERLDLLSLASDFIEKSTKQLYLFDNKQSNNILYLNQTGFIGVYYTFLYEFISKLIIAVGFDKIKNRLLLDLVILRMVEPSSKLRSISLLDEYFGIKHRRQSYYQSAPQWLSLKAKTEAIALAFAHKYYSFNFDLLFYDVTTLYFESFEEDKLRKNGFSKDNKFQQPQILVALMVSKEGFPIAYEVFAGNTFEGHTIVPVVKDFISKNKVKELTVVADAAMISTENTRALKENGINYIVGARLGNLPNELITAIDSNLPREDGKSIRLQTDNGYLICSYSTVRYRKDKYEMERQIERAKYIITHPSQNKKLKFTKSNKENIELNQKLIDKTQKILGIKGYYTNLEESMVDNKTIIEHYHELYKIEQAFRISKSDLQTRPIFHYKEEPIKLHLLICFMALVVSKHIELQTRHSIRKFIHECKKITDARLKNQITDKEIRIRANLTPTAIEFLKNLNC
ncbi:MAG: IS1634 family transposase [Sphingobacteriales bacterium]|nr:IS1634 family transposase [Sphingobacteriales bacterium]